ncbi:MAG: hypothetical protein HQM14_11410 [SAR324 cluster bacterium]|nr:hypothetical protein [SAR324 cluster bacterium]
METTFYSLSVHSDCIEGISLEGHDQKLLIQSEYSAAFLQADEEQELSGKIEKFLEGHQWQDNYTSMIIPAEEVNFRTVLLDLQDKNKIKKALPMQIKDEFLENAAEKIYYYTIEPLPDGQSRVFLFLTQKAYLESLQTVANQRNLLIRNIDCAAHVLFKSVPYPGDVETSFQVYLGAEETFINVIEGQCLQVVKIFPNRIPVYLAEYPDLQKIVPSDFLQMVNNPTGNVEKYPDLNKESLTSLLALIQEEIQDLCRQFNMFVKGWQLSEKIHVSFHGLFQTTIAWDGKSFAWSPADGIAESERSAFQKHWGILGELKKYGWKYLDGPVQSFYSEVTLWLQFWRKHRMLAFAGMVLLALGIGLLTTNYFLQLHAMEKEIQVIEQQLQVKLKRLVPGKANQDRKTAIAELQNKIKKKKAAQQDARFTQRSYNNLEFLQKISTLLPESIEFRVQHLELNKARFTLKGVIDSYKSLQTLKNGIAEFTEFKGKTIVENNRSTPNGILYNISVSL